MTHTDLKNAFMIDWQGANPKGRIFDNNTGWAKFGKSMIPYGFPPPLKKKKGGGGADCIACPGHGIMELYEVKTIDDDLKPNQIKTLKMFLSLGFDVFIVQELKNGWEIIRF